MSAAKEIADLDREYRSFNWPRPVFELALRWLRERDPGPSDEVTLVHGDFRHGNLIIGPDGLRAVLDWELAHLGDPMEDLGWVCVNSWRFGEIDKPVGGFGSREELFAGYEAAGRRVDPDRVMFWEVMGTLRWGVMCCGMMQRFRIGPGSFDGARHDRPPFIGDRDRFVAAIGTAGMIPKSGSRFLDQIMPNKKRNDMQDEPTPTELIKAVADFLRNEITPEIKGHNAFKLRVGINALDLVTRQLALEQGSDAAETARLTQLLGSKARSAISTARCPKDRKRRGRSEDAWSVRASLANHDGQTRRRSAELRFVQEGIGGEA